MKKSEQLNAEVKEEGKSLRQREHKVSGKVNEPKRSKGQESCQNDVESLCERVAVSFYGSTSQGGDKRRDVVDACGWGPGVHRVDQISDIAV